jgi:hypothetical protein
VPLGDQGQFLVPISSPLAVANRAARAHLRDTYPKYLADLFSAKAEAAKTRRLQRIRPGRGSS